ncbi:ArsR family transcriptional regulator [Thalassolituus sp. LLYu03]|uniref:ArsR family transcriptional regulator n=1 Tax=Thalassolituus sp. LLYu03 TaxID=3421656 RepID=UPI003D2C8562
MDSAARLPDTQSAPLSLTPLTLFRCLNDDTRLSLVLLLHSRGELCVCDLISALNHSQAQLSQTQLSQTQLSQTPISQPKVSRHLQPLRESGLLTAEKRGQWVYYRINPALEDWALDILSAAARASESQIQALAGHLFSNCCVTDTCG